jgi:F-type H+-transporting ATPase subunit a
MESPLQSLPLFMVGQVPIMPAVVVTWGIMVVLVLGAILLTRRLTVVPGPGQATAELLVGAVDSQIRDVTGAAPAPYRAFVGTLFLFILTANWSSLIPGITPPPPRWKRLRPWLASCSCRSSSLASGAAVWAAFCAALRGPTR